MEQPKGTEMLSLLQQPLRCLAQLAFLSVAPWVACFLCDLCSHYSQLLHQANVSVPSGCAIFFR